MRSDENKLEGRNPVIEAFRAGRVIDKVYVVSGSHDGPLRTIVREASKANVPVEYVGKDRLDKMSSSGMHQGVIALCSVCEYSTIDDILKAAEDRGEDPFIFILDGIEDPHNLGAIIRTVFLGGMDLRTAKNITHRRCCPCRRRRAEFHSHRQGD